MRWIDNGQTNDLNVILEYIDNEHFFIKDEDTMQYLSVHENDVNVVWKSNFCAPNNVRGVFRSTSGFVTTLYGMWIRFRDNRFFQVNPDQCILTLNTEEYVSIASQSSSEVICISDDESEDEVVTPIAGGKGKDEVVTPIAGCGGVSPVLSTASDEDISFFAAQLERDLDELNYSRNVDTSIIKRKKGRPKGSKNKNGTKIKHVRTAGQIAFTAFQKDHRKKLKTNCPYMTFSEMSKEIGETWQKLSEDERQYYYP